MSRLATRDRECGARAALANDGRETAASAEPRVAALLAMQRTAGNQSTGRAVRALRGRGGRRLQRQFTTLQTDLAGHVAGELKVVVPTGSEVERLDALWKQHMAGIPPVDFVVRALNGLQALVPGHHRVYVTFKPTGPAKVTFEIKLQEVRESPTRPEGGTLTKTWTQTSATRWYRNLAGATRDLSFGEQLLEVADQRTDAPTGVPGGSGFTRQLFKNLLALYTEARPNTVLDLTADEDGRYVWARYGFLPSAGEWKAKIRDPIRTAVADSPGAELADRLEAHAKLKGKPIDHGAAARIAAALERDDPLALFEIVDTAQAKDFVWWLFTSGIVEVWKGRLDLQDPVQGPRVRAYVDPPKPAAAQPPGALQIQSAEELVGATTEQ